MQLLSDEQLKQIRNLRPISNSVSNTLLRTYESEAIRLYLLRVFDADFINTLIEYNKDNETQTINDHDKKICKAILNGKIYFSRQGKSDYFTGLIEALLYLICARMFMNQQLIISQNAIKKHNTDVSNQAETSEVKRLSRDCLNMGLLLLKDVYKYVKTTEFKNKIKYNGIEELTFAVISCKMIGE